MKVPQRVKHFVWRAAKNVLPTKDHLIIKKISLLICALFVMKRQKQHITPWCHVVLLNMLDPVTYLSP